MLLLHWFEYPFSPIHAIQILHSALPLQIKIIVDVDILLTRSAITFKFGKAGSDFRTRFCAFICYVYKLAATLLANLIKACLVNHLHCLSLYSVRRR